MAWIDLTDARAYMRKHGVNPSDDDLIETFIAGACGQIEDLMGHVDPVSFELVGYADPVNDAHRHRYHLRSWVLSLPETPVAAVSSVDLLDGVGGTSVLSPSDLVAGVHGWELVDTMLRLPLRGPYRVVYTAGRNPIPGNFVQAALELVVHHWRRSQLNRYGGRGPKADDQTMVVPGSASALPFAVRELLGIYGEIVSDHPVIA
jgi:hypothetical protein